MGELRRRYRKSPGKGRATAFAAAMVLLAVSSCGVIAEQGAGGRATGTRAYDGGLRSAVGQCHSGAGSHA